MVLNLNNFSFITATLEMQSYSVKLKRIRRPGSLYLAIDKNGRVRSRVSDERINETVFTICFIQNIVKGRIHCEIFLSEYFMKY